MQTHELSKIEQKIAPLLTRYGCEPSMLLQILREVQETFNFIPPDAITAIADHLGVPRTDVEGVASFYSFLSLDPVGEYRILFSSSVTDQMKGSSELMQYFCQKLWLEPGKVSEDNLLSVDSTSCTGMSDQGPAALVNGYALTNLNQERLDLIANLVRDRRPVGDWPSILFEVKDNI